MRVFWDQKQLLHRVSCPVCDKPADLGVPFVRRLDDLILKRCSNCNGVFVDPCPSDEALMQLYTMDYFRSSLQTKWIGPGADYCSISDEEIASGRINGHAEVVSSFDLEGKTVLEIGCATGSLLKSLEQYGPKKL